MTVMPIRQQCCALLLVFAGCSTAPPAEPSPVRPPATTEEEFERNVQELQAGCSKEPLFIFPSTLFYARPMEQLTRLAELACTSPKLYDRLIELGLTGAFLDHGSPCALGEGYSVSLAMRLLAEKNDWRRSVLLSALRHHSRHAHIREAASQPYASTAPGLIARVHESLPEQDRWIASQIEAAYSLVVRDARDVSWARAADERESSPIRARVLDVLMREVFPAADPEARLETLHWFCDSCVPAAWDLHRTTS
jgi:hypothetical protein